MSNRINQKLRSYNYKIIIHENEVLKRVVEQAKQKLEKAQINEQAAEKQAEEAQEVADGFDLLADSLELSTEIIPTELALGVEKVPTGNVVPVFKGETGTTPNEKSLTVVKAEIAKGEENKFNITLTFSEPSDIIDRDSGARLVHLDALVFEGVSIEAASEEADEIGDCIKCKPISEDPSFNAPKLWVKKLSSEQPELGQVVQGDAIYVVNWNAETETVLIRISEGQTVDIRPIPEEIEEQP